MKNRLPFLFVFVAILLLEGCGIKQSPGDAEKKFQIAFYSSRSTNGDIFLMDTALQHIKQFTYSDSSCFAPRWVPAFNEIIYAKQTGAGALLQRQSLDLRLPVTTIANNPAYEEVPDWAPNGDRTIFTTLVDGKPQIALGDQNGNVIVMLTQDTFSNKQPVFGPFGNSILFVSNRSGNQDIFKLDLSTQALVNLSDHPAMEGHPHWSPKGDQILFYRYEDGNADLYTLNLNTKALKNITNTPTNELVGRFSPDGKYVAIGGIADDDWEIFIAKSDGSGRKRLTYQKGFDGDPFWILSE